MSARCRDCSASNGPVAAASDQAVELLVELVNPGARCTSEKDNKICEMDGKARDCDRGQCWMSARLSPIT